MRELKLILLLVLAATLLGIMSAGAQAPVVPCYKNTPTAQGCNNVSPTTPLPVTLDGSVAGQVVVTPSALAAAGTTRAQTAAAASSLVVKATAGNLYDFNVNIGATSGYVMLFNAASAPADGAVTPAWCRPVTSNGTNGAISAAFPTPMAFATGITVVFSTTGCFSKTASATNVFMAAGYK